MGVLVNDGVMGRGFGSKQSPCLAYLPPFPLREGAPSSPSLAPGLGMWAGLAPALAHRPAGCRPSRPPPPGGRGSLLCLHRVVVSLAHGWGWVGMEGPHLPCLCSSSSLPQTWGPAALDPWASLLSASPILAGPPRGDLGEGGCREPRPGVAGGSGCGWKPCHRIWGRSRGAQRAQERRKEGQGSKDRGELAPLPVFLFHIPDPTLEPGKERGGGWRGSWLRPQDTPRK